MKKRSHLATTVMSILLLLFTLPDTIQAVSQQGLAGINYGLVVPLALGLFSFIMWLRSED